MTERGSGASAAARVVATVGRGDGAKGYVLTPVDGGAEVICPMEALRAVGLEFLTEGTTVTCETAPGEDGLEVARILAVEFPAAGAGEPRDGETGEAPAAPAGRPASGQAVAATVKWFQAARGYGFLEPEDGSGDIFCHAGAVRAAGRETLPRGAAVTCEVETGARGRQVSRILAVEDPPEGMPAEGPRPRERAQSAAGGGARLEGEVKFYDAAKGFGFVVPDGGGEDVFVHASALARSGLDGLDAGQWVVLRAVDGPRGRQAVEVKLVEDGID